MNQLEITTILKHVENSIKEIASVEGKITRIIRTGNRVAIKFENNNHYDIILMTKNTIQAVLDSQHVDLKYDLPSNGVIDIMTSNH